MLKDWNVPGIGVGIVVKDKLVFAKGYGYRDRESCRTRQRPCSVASTRSLYRRCGGLLSEGKIDWDSRSGTMSPPSSSTTTTRITITLRDMLSHRTGITRTTSCGTSLTSHRAVRAIQVPRARRAARTTFPYNNLMYGDGLFHRLLSGKPWQAFVTERILRR